MSRDHLTIAREYLARAQSIAEVDLGHGLFAMGCALKHTLDALEAHQHSLRTGSPKTSGYHTGPALPVQEEL